MDPQSSIPLTYFRPRVRPRLSKLAIAALAAAILSYSVCVVPDEMVFWVGRVLQLEPTPALRLTLTLPGGMAVLLSGIALVRIFVSRKTRRGVGMSLGALALGAISSLGGFVVAEIVALSGV